VVRSRFVLCVFRRLLLDGFSIWLLKLWLRHICSSGIIELHTLPWRFLWLWMELLQPVRIRILLILGFKQLQQLLSGIVRINERRFDVFVGVTRILRVFLGTELVCPLSLCLLDACRRGGMSSGRRGLSRGPVLHGVGLHRRACRILHSDGGFGHVLCMRCGELLDVWVVRLLVVSCGNLHK